MSEARRYTASSNLLSALIEDERSASWLARKCGISQSFMSYLIHGERTAGHELAASIAQILDRPLFLLFEFTDANVECTETMGAVA